jgi:hypothetical protein
MYLILRYSHSDIKVVWYPFSMHDQYLSNLFWYTDSSFSNEWFDRFLLFEF